MVKQITVSPPITPPTIAPVFVGFCPGSAGVEFEVDDAGNKLDRMLELKAVAMDVSVVETVGCKVELDEEALPRTELEIEVVVASTTFGTAKRRSVLACAPQAMYSND